MKSIENFIIKHDYYKKNNHAIQFDEIVNNKIYLHIYFNRELTNCGWYEVEKGKIRRYNIRKKKYCAIDTDVEFEKFLRELEKFIRENI